MNRAWTLQESGVGKDKSFVAGISDESPRVDGHSQSDPNVHNFAARMARIGDSVHGDRKLIWAIEEMHRRHAVSDLDKIAGLNYLSSAGTETGTGLPIFNSSDPEDLWRRFVQALAPGERSELFFLFPRVGAGGPGSIWYPSWKQLAKAALTGMPMFTTEDVSLADYDDGIYFDGAQRRFFIKRRPVTCYITKTAQKDRKGGSVWSVTVDQFIMTASLDRDVPLESGKYALLIATKGKPGSKFIRFAVGHIGTFEKDKEFRKVAVIDVQLTHGVKRYWEPAEAVYLE